MHSRYEQVDRNMGKCKANEKDFCYGGFARIHEMVKHFKIEAQAVGRSTLFVNAGDTFTGTPYYTQFKGELAAKMMNTLDIDVMTLGNHEFDDGIQPLASYIDKVNIPVVCSNLDLSQEPKLQTPKITSSITLTVNGTKVGIVGCLTTTTVNNHNLGGVKILDEMSSIRKEVSKLKDEGVNVIIALSHSGYDVDLKIAKLVEDIDVIVGGHTHTFLYSGKKIPELEEPSGPYPTVVTQESGKQVLVVQAYFGTKYLGYLELNFNSEGELKSFNGSPILLIGLFPQDPDILRVLEPYKERLEGKTNKIIGYTHVFLDSNNYKCKVSECELGNLITDAFADYMEMRCPSLPVSVGLMNAGGIRSSFDPISGGHNGSITLGDVMTVLPWGKPIVAVNLTGRVLLQVLEHAVSRFDEIKTSNVHNFLQVSGLRVTYDLSREVGHQLAYIYNFALLSTFRWQCLISQKASHWQFLQCIVCVCVHWGANRPPCDY
ncbi:protein 5NUC-like [Macrosteles quadrilineatus]|uniref:protein 5NUC-like n=1 Tax=Macrosteles quadrilineatus TaxID=74068 RepID=UPI0023E3307B|nr:protein 5NUC-like [Macrosteles quadrilineatus]